MEPTEFDPATCVTAGDLRENGIPIPESVSDIAWVPLDAIKLRDWNTVHMADAAPRITATLMFMQPFRGA
jgi:hypothetical protein